MRRASSSSVRVFWPRYSRDQLIALLRDRAGELQKALPVVRAVLFGSWAAGRATAFSDVDVLVVYAKPRRPDAYDVAFRILQVGRLELHIYTEAEAQQLAPTLDRMTANGVDLL